MLDGALTDPELAYLRSDGQHCSLYLAVHAPTEVFRARVHGDPASDDRVVEIAYDGGSAGFAAAIPGQTVYVSASAYGAYDKGIARLRGTLAGTTGTMKIGETSEIAWAAGDYLTVVDEFALWPKHLRIDDAGETLMDYEIDYGDQHALPDPVPVLGPPAVAWLVGKTVDVTFDASDSWVVGGSITDWDWVASGGVWDNDTSPTPTLTLNAAGTYRVACTVTANNAKMYTGYRYVFVYGDALQPVTAFTLDSCSGVWETGGWSFRVMMFDEARRSEIRDRALVILFAKDWYGGTEVSIGPVAGRENIVCVGWIVGESIEWNPEQGSVSFTVQGPHWWLNQMTGFPSGIEDYDGLPTNWLEFNDLTVDKGLWHFLHWRTTASLCLDYTLSGDTREIAVFDAPIGSLWQQLTRVSQTTILAHPACDRHGRLFVEIDSQLVPEAERDGIPTVHDLAASDWREQIAITRRIVNEAAQVDLSGIAYAAGSGTPFFALAPGHVFKHFGSQEVLDRLALETQNQANLLTGLVAGNYNNPYPVIEIPLAANHRIFDICPWQYAEITIQESDTERGIALTDFKMVPRRVSFQHDLESGMLLADMACEGYTTELSSTNGDPPPEPPDAEPYLDPPDSWPPPTLPTFDPIAFVMTNNHIARSFDWLTSTLPTWEPVELGLAEAGTLQAFDIAPNGLGLLVTVGDDLDECGLFVCDILAGLPSWQLVLSLAEARAQANGSGDTFRSVAASRDNKGYVVMNMNVAYSRPCYWYTAGGAPTQVIPSIRDNTMARAGYQSSMCADDDSDEVFFTMGGNYDAGGHVVAIPSCEWAKCKLGWYNARDFQVCSAEYAISQWNDILAHHPPTGENLYEVLYADAWLLRRLLQTGDTLVWTRTDGILMVNEREIADPAEVFGPGKTGANYECVYATSTNLIWLCANSDPGVPYIVFTDDEGGSWESKVGNWEMAVGDWAAGNTFYPPMVRVFAYPE